MKKAQKIIPYQMLNERYWQGVQQFLNTQSYIIYTMSYLNFQMPVAAYGKPGLYMEKYTSLSA